jgi:multidrug efflux pump subunit AcrA (membrane-fusion protein)
MYGFEKQGISSYSLSIMKSEYPGTLLACFLCESMGCFGEKQMERQKEPKIDRVETQKRNYFSGHGKRMSKGILLLLVALGLMVGTAALYFRGADAQSAAPYQTRQVTRGDLLVAISATGTVEPEEVVDVGAQVAGQILSFGKDAQGKTVDYGSVVESGTVLARIDDSLYAADAAQAEAQVQSAKASLQRAEADLGQMKAKLLQAERDWQRAQKLGPSEALAQASCDAYQSAYETAKANVAVGEAAILQAQQSLYASEDTFLQSTQTVSTNLVALYKALGGGWQAELQAQKLP